MIGPLVSSPTATHIVPLYAIPNAPLSNPFTATFDQLFPPSELLSNPEPPKYASTVAINIPAGDCIIVFEDVTAVTVFPSRIVDRPL